MIMTMFSTKTENISSMENEYKLNPQLAITSPLKNRFTVASKLPLKNSRTFDEFNTKSLSNIVDNYGIKAISNPNIEKPLTFSPGFKNASSLVRDKSLLSKRLPISLASNNSKFFKNNLLHPSVKIDKENNQACIDNSKFDNSQNKEIIDLISDDDDMV